MTQTTTTQADPIIVQVPGSLAPNVFALRLNTLAAWVFVLGALLVWLVRANVRPFAADALAAYAALSLSALAGLHIGLAMRSRVVSSRPYVWAVACMLLAWVGLVMPSRSGLIVLGVMLAGTYLVDRRHYGEFDATPWLMARFRLSAVACFACMLGAAGV
mgnify:CR=1 FL=1